MTNENSSSPRPLKTLVTAHAVIEALVRLDGAGVTELASHLDRSKSTVYTYLQTLEQIGFVTKTNHQYRLSYRFLLLGEHVRHSSLLFEVGSEEVNKLADEFGQYAHLVVKEGGRGVVLHHAEGADAVTYEYQRSKLQQGTPLHMTASGKAILATLSADQVATIIDQHGLDQSTDQTITDSDRLFTELDTIREHGYACNDEEEIEGYRAVAAPISASNADVRGAISVSGPTSVLDDEAFTTTLPPMVQQSANTIEVSLNMMQNRSRRRTR